MTLRIDGAGFRLSLNSASLPLFAAKNTTYEQSFDAVANGTTLNTLSGWSAWDTAGAVLTTGKALNRLASGGVVIRGGTADFDAGIGGALIGREVGSDAFIQFRISAIWASSQQWPFAIAATSPAQCLYISLANSGGAGITSVKIYKRVAGVNTQLVEWFPGITTINRNLTTGDTIRFATHGTKVYLYANDVLLTSADTGAFTKGTRAGLGSYQSSNSGSIDDLVIAPLTASVVVTNPKLFWPATAAAGGTSVALSGTYQGTVTALRYRVRRSDGTVVSDWAAMSSVTIGGGTWSASGFVPTPTAAAPDLRVDVCPYDDRDGYGPSTTFTVGLVFATWGQSNSEFRRGGNDTGAISSAAHSYQPAAAINSTEAVWKNKTTITSGQWGGLVIATELANALNVPVGVVVMGIGAQAIKALNSEATTTFSDTAGVLPARIGWEWAKYHFGLAGATGKIQGWLWTQGEQEAGSPEAETTAYPGRFGVMLADFQAISEPSSVSVAIAGIGWLNDVPADAAAANAGWTRVRAMLAGLPATYTQSYSTGSLIGCEMTDAYHLTAAGYNTANIRAGMSMAVRMSGSGVSGRGPLITGASRAGAVVTLTVNLNGATSLSGTGLTNYEVSADDFATTLTISSVNVSGSTIVITLAADPGATVKVRSFQGYSWASAVFALGAYSNGQSIPVEPIYTAITAT